MEKIKQIDLKCVKNAINSILKLFIILVVIKF